jgi:hypothetical protein
MDKSTSYLIQLSTCHFLAKTSNAARAKFWFWAACNEVLGKVTPIPCDKFLLDNMDDNRGTTVPCV